MRINCSVMIRRRPRRPLDSPQAHATLPNSPYRSSLRLPSVRLKMYSEYENSYSDTVKTGSYSAEARRGKVSKKHSVSFDPPRFASPYFRETWSRHTAAQCSIDKLRLADVKAFKIKGMMNKSDRRNVDYDIDIQ